MSQIKKIAVIGTGVIGTGWIIRCLAHNKIVHAYDKDIKLKKNLITEIKRTWPSVKKLFNKKKLNLKNFKYFTSIEEALKDADLVQECASENYDLKTKLMSAIGKYAKRNAIISSSSSGLLPFPLDLLFSSEVLAGHLRCLEPLVLRAIRVLSNLRECCF